MANRDISEEVNLLQHRLETAVSQENSPQVIGRILQEANREEIRLDLFQPARAALEKGKTEAVKSYLNILQDPDTTGEVLDYIAMQRGRGSRYIFENFVRTYPRYINRIAVGLASVPGYLDRLTYLIGRGANNFAEMLRSAMEDNNTEVIRYILQEKRDFITDDDFFQLLEGVVVACNIPLLQLLMNYYYNPTEEGIRSLLESVPSGAGRCKEMRDYLRGLLPEEGEGGEEGEEDVMSQLSTAIQTNDIRAIILILSHAQGSLTEQNISYLLSEATFYCNVHAFSLLLTVYLPSRDERIRLLQLATERTVTGDVECQEIRRILRSLPTT